MMLKDPTSTQLRIMLLGLPKYRLIEFLMKLKVLSEEQHQRIWWKI